MTTERDRGGHYEVRPINRMGVPLVQIVWVKPGQLPIVSLEVTPLRLHLLGQAITSYLAGDQAEPGTS
jgi:hypothetical protein